MIEDLRRLCRRIVGGRAGGPDERHPRVATDGGRPGREGGAEGAAAGRTERTNGTAREQGLSARIWSKLSSPFQEPAPDPISPTERPAEAYLDHCGSFCETTFERKTGVSVSTFVVEYVEEHGGVVRQQAIVGCLPWSDSKVSRLLGDLECEGRLVRQSMGRENAVFLPDAVPEET
jgi:hypothetical protein